MKKQFGIKFLSLLLLLCCLKLMILPASVFALTTNSSILPPSNLAIQLTTPDDAKLTWSSVYGASGYNIYGITEGQLSLLGTTTSTSYTFSDIPEGSYSYVVSTLSADGESGPCAPVSVDIVYPDMTAPSSLTDTVQNINDVVLKWSSSLYAQSYNIYRISEDGQNILLTSVTNCAYTVTNSPAGTSKYAVSAVNPLYGESPISDSIEVNIVFPVMEAPKNATSRIQNGTDVVLTWSAASYANSYKIYELIDAQEVLQSTVTSTTSTLTNISSGTHNYVIHSVSSRFGESAQGSQISATLGDVTMTPPGNFSYTINNGNDIVLSWERAANATSYKVYQVINGEKTLRSTVTGTTVTFTNVPAGDYSYEIHSYSATYGESADGKQLTFNLAFPIMQPPVNLIQTVKNATDFVLNWDTAPNANSYKVYQIVDGQKVLKNTVYTTTISYANMAPGEYTFEVHSYSSRFGESVEGTTLVVTLNGQTMEAPANLTYSIANQNDITLKWTAVQYATGYQIYQVIDGQKQLKKSVTATYVTFTNMPAGDYTFIVTSVSNALGESPMGAEVNLSLVLPTMAAPGNLNYKIQNVNTVVLSWNAADNANNYKVYEVLNGQEVLKTTVTSLTATISNVPAGDHTYAVHSVNSRFGESQEGSRVLISLNQDILAPADLAYSIANGNDLTLKWTAAEYTTSYNIYQVIDGQFQLKKTGTATSVTFTNMPAGDYLFAVTSVSTVFGESKNKSEVTVPLVHPTMESPVNLAYGIKNANNVVLTWDSVNYATNYKVYEVVDGKEVLKSTVSTLTATLSNVKAGNHTYAVHSASSRFGESQKGSQVSLAINQQILPPENLEYSIANGNTIILKWTAAEFATGYKVYQVLDGQKQLLRSVSTNSVTLANMPEGDYNFAVTSVSSAFGESINESAISLSLVFPVMEAPENLTQSILNGNDITLKWTAAEFATGYKVYRVLDGQKQLLRSVSTNTVTLANMPAGEYHFAVTSVSSIFGESSNQSEISLTLVHPVMEAPGNFSQSIANGNDITLKWNTAAYATSYNVYQVSNGQKSLVKTVTGTSVTFVNMPSGDYIYEVNSYSSRFGESPSGSTLNFKLVWPVVQPPVITDTIYNVNNITLSWQTSDWANEYRVYEIDSVGRELLYKGTALSYKIYNLSQGVHSYEVTGYNTRFGESEPSNRITETIIYPEMQSPTASVNVLNSTTALIYWNFITYANGYNVYEVVDGNPVLLTGNLNNLSYQVSNLSYKNHQYYVTSYSNSFGESLPSNIVTAVLIVDTKAPVTTSDAPISWINQSPLVVSLSATDNMTGVAHTYYSLNDSNFTEGTSVSVDSEGINKISFYSVDKVGNTEEVKTIEVKIDKAAPVTTAANIPDGWTNEDVTVTLTAVDEQSGVAKTFYSIDDSEYVEGSSFTVKAEGIHKISYYSVDAAGNTETAKTIEFKSDKTAPVTTVANIPDGWTNEDVTVTLTAVDDQSGVAKTFYSIDDSEYLEGSSFTVNTEGSHKISYYSVDAAGNTETAKTIEFKSDKTAPVTTAANIPDGWTNEDVTVTLTAVDEQSGVAKTFYSIDDSGYVEGSSFTVNTEGSHKISYYSVDIAGNTETAKTIEFKTDKTAPVTTASNIPDGWTNEDVTVTLTAVDEQSGVAKTFYSIDDSEYVEGSSFTVKAEGIHKISYYSVDIAGNQEDAKAAEVKIVKAPPVISINLNEEYKLGSTIKLSYKVDITSSTIVSEKMVVTGPDEITGKVVKNNSCIQLNKPGVYIVTITVTDDAGISSTLEKKITVFIPACIQVLPQIIICNNGVLNVHVCLPGKYCSKDFDLNTATLNGVKALSSCNGYYNQAKLGLFKFKRSDFNFKPLIEDVEFRCYINGYLVVGQTSIIVLK